MRSQPLRQRLVTAFLLVLLIADAGVGVYARIHKGRLHMLSSEASHVMAKLGAALHVSSNPLSGRLSDGDLPLEMYPNHDHLQYQEAGTLEVFGRLPDDFNALSSSERELLENMAATVAETGHADRFFAKFPRFREAQRQRHRAGVLPSWEDIRNGANNLGNRISNGATAIKNGVSNTINGAINLGKEFAGWVRGTYKTVEEGVDDWRKGRERCKPGAWQGQLDGDLYEIIGTPVSGVYRVADRNYFKFDFEKRSWTFGSEEKGPWTPIEQYKGPASAAVTIMQKRNPAPFGPPDAMDALGCPDAKTKSFMYDAGILATPLWFKFDAELRVWSWTPDPPGTPGGQWIPTSSLKANSPNPDFNGKTPVEDNVDVIQLMEAYITLGHVNKLPEKFGENVLKRGVRNMWNDAKKVWRAAFAPIVKQIVELKKKVQETAANLSKFRFSELGANIEKLSQYAKNQPVRFMSQIALNIIVGYFNGMLYGLLGHIGHATHECDLGAAVMNLVEKYKASVAALCNLAKNFHINAIGAGFRKLFEAICDVHGALKQLIFGCPPLNKLLLMILISVGVVLLINAVVVATGYGAVMKIIWIVIDLISAGVYLTDTVLKVLNGIAALGSRQTEEKAHEEFLGLLWNLSGLAGCLTSVILTFKEMKLELPEAKEAVASPKETFANSVLGKKLGLSAKEVGEGVANAAKVKEAAASAKAGKGDEAVQKAGITPETAKQAGLEKGPPTKPNEAAAPTTPTTPKETPQLMLPAPPKNAQEYKLMLPAPKAKLALPPGQVQNGRIFVATPEGTIIVKQLDLAVEQVQLAKVAEEATSVAKVADAPVVAPSISVVGGKVKFTSRLKEAGYQVLGTLKDVMTGKVKLPQSVTLPFRKMKDQFLKLNERGVFKTDLHKAEEIVLFINQHKLAMELYEWAHMIYGKEEHGAPHGAPHNDGADIDNLEKEAAAHGIPTDAHPNPTKPAGNGHH